MIWYFANVTTTKVRIPQVYVTIKSKILRGGLSGIPDDDVNLRPYSLAANLLQVSALNGDISAQLSFGRVASNPIRVKSEAKRDKNEYATDTANPITDISPPGRRSGGVRSFPLGAKIGFALILAGAAIIRLWLGAMRPFGLLMLRRGDIAKALGYGVLSAGLFALSFKVWLLGG